ncbi:ATP-dependent nuclease [Vibrio rotiferianus]|uniref:ATP-dependent nuclease n=1 Tax=Vibrio rotiferianus TaxID=190895 RepID=UPI00397F0756
MTKTIEEYKTDLSDVIDRIKLPESQFFVFNSGKGDWSLSGVQKFNFFVGANNSGKSRVLRHLFSMNVQDWNVDSELLPTSYLLEQLTEDDITRGAQKSDFHNIDHEVVVEVLNKMKDTPPAVPLSHLADTVWERAKRGSSSTSEDREQIQRYIFGPIYRQDKTIDDRQNFISSVSSQYGAEVYIPTLRTLRHISDEDHYHTRTMTDYFKAKLGSRKSLFTGHGIAQDLKAHLLGSYEKREKVRKFEKFLSEQFFYGADISLTPRIDDNVVWFKEGDKAEYPIYALGDGIQAIIILTYKVFMAEYPTVFFMEEPEKYLHAGMQRTLIEALASIPHHMFFMTTHSNHFLDLALERGDVATHQVSQHEGKTLTCSATELNDLLDELGVRASSVLLANCSIWVEGVTDKLYLRAYMNKYLKELEAKGANPERVERLKSHLENLHYVFVEYQGSNITHWAFNHDESDLEKTSAYLLNNKIFLLADGDIDWKGERTENLSSHLGAQFHQLELKEIENYIPVDVIKKTAELRLGVMKKSMGCTLNFDSFSQQTYAKKRKGIGHYLEQCVEKPEDLEKSFFEEVGKSSTGTIRDKVTFCKEAVRYMNNHPDDWALTEELTELCDKLWRHIEHSNKPNLNKL